MILYCLNLLDMIVTLCSYSHGFPELNPIMDVCLANHPVLFVVIKLAVLPLCLWLAERKSKAYPYLVGAYAAVVWWGIMNIANILQ